MSRWPNKVVIGLTGNIAVGKSVVRQMLQHLGAYTIDADGLAHQAMAPGAPSYQPIVETFGRWILDSEGKINRGLLGTIVFAHPQGLALLERLTHPVVLQAINTLVTRAQQPVVVIEAIKLFETDLASAVDAVWVVDASPETQLKRLVEKRGMSPDDAKRRITAQRAQNEKLKQAGVIIRNDGNVEETWKQVQAAWTALRRGAKLGTSEQSAVPVARQPEAPTQPRPAAPAAPAAPVAQAAAPTAVAPTSITVRRGMPGNAELIARFITQSSGRQVDRMDIMMAFGQKSYLLAQDDKEEILAVLGWQVENLITRADEFYLAPNIAREPVIDALIVAIEDASKELQSEVGFILLPENTPPETIQPFLKNGYEKVTLEEIRIPAWREAVHEIAHDNQRILTKKLRADRVMKPI